MDAKEEWWQVDSPVFFNSTLKPRYSGFNCKYIMSPRTTFSRPNRLYDLADEESEQRLTTVCCSSEPSVTPAMQMPRGRTGACTGLGGKQGTRTFAERLGETARRLCQKVSPLLEANRLVGTLSCIDPEPNPDSSIYGASGGRQRFLHGEAYPMVKGFQPRLGDNSGIFKGLDIFSFKFKEGFHDVKSLCMKTNFILSDQKLKKSRLFCEIDFFFHEYLVSLYISAKTWGENRSKKNHR